MVTLKPKTEITVPRSIRRKAGIKAGDRFESTASGRVINIVPRLSPDELQDESEIRDPKIRAVIKKATRSSSLQESDGEIFVAWATRAAKGSKQPPGA